MTVPQVSTRTISECVKNWFLNPSPALLVNTLITPTDVLPALALARPAHQPPSASHVSLLVMNLIQLEYALLNVVMDSSLDLRLVILETAPQLVVLAARSSKDGLAVDNLQSADPTLMSPLLPSPLLSLLLSLTIKLPVTHPVTHHPVTHYLDIYNKLFDKFCVN